MTQYIGKDALVAEFNRLISELVEEGEGTMFEQGRISAFEDAKLFLDTLEVKEVDLDFQRFAKEMDFVFALPSSKTKNTEEEPLCWEYAIAKHFFELGIAVNNKAQKGEEV